jgi:hypothetical protein
MDDETAAWVRVEAAKADTSVSRWIGEILRQRRCERDAAYERAYRYWQSRVPTKLKEPGERYPRRDELYDR